MDDNVDSICGTPEDTDRSYPALTSADYRPEGLFVQGLAQRKHFRHFLGTHGRAGIDGIFADISISTVMVTKMIYRNSLLNLLYRQFLFFSSSQYH